MSADASQKHYTGALWPILIYHQLNYKNVALIILFYDCVMCLLTLQESLGRYFNYKNSAKEARIDAVYIKYKI